VVVGFLFATALAGCGGGGGGGNDAAPPADNPPTGGTSTAPDVTLDKLTGDWFGVFDPGGGGATSKAQFTIDSTGNLKAFTIGADATHLTGPITKASDGPRLFRFSLKENDGQAANPFVQGVLMADPSGTYVFYVDEFFQTMVLQRASAAPTFSFSQADIEATWKGDSTTVASVSPSQPATTGGTPGTGFGALTPAASTNACQAAAPASSCTITTGSTTRTASKVTLTGSADSRWVGTYTQTPAGTGTGNVLGLYMSADKKFAGGFACGTEKDFKTCEFYSLPKQ
jgi:hypothetical protein